MSDIVKIDQLETVIVNSLEEVIEEDEKALEANVKAAGQKATRLLKQRSRKRKRHGGSFAKAWTYDVDTDQTGTSCTVHNKDQYQLTHLLEKGHAIKTQLGSYPGTVAGDHVVQGVYEEVAAEFAQGAADE